MKRRLILMTGTPLTTPSDVYGYTRLTNPTAYQSERLFDLMHVANRDHFKSVVAWKNEEVLQENFLKNGARVFRREVDPNLPPVTYEPIPYEMHPDHYLLYRTLAEEAMLELEGQETIDFLTASALNSALQQVIVGFEHYFDEGAEREKAHAKVRAFELLDSVMESLGDRKLICFAYYQKAIDSIVNHNPAYGAVAVNGRISAKQQQINLDRFVEDPKCRLLVAQPLSAGAGLDNLKDVCSDMLFLEMPMVAKDFVQAVGRIDRNGQQERCHVRIAVAQGTLQVKRQETLLSKDETANKIQLTHKNLRDWIYGL